MNLHDEIDKKANAWIMKEHESLTLQEEVLLQEWLENKQHKESYEVHKKVINECLNLDEQLIQELEDEVMETSFMSRYFHQYKYYAASIILVCFMALGIIEVQNYFIPTYENRIIASKEKILNIHLPDETIMDLDVQSEVKITYFNNKRDVELIKGKLLVWVSKDKERPFIIKSGKTLIEVLGTKFEVVKAEQKTKINVVEGLVRVNHIYNHNEDTKALIQLKKAQTFTVNDSGRVENYDRVSFDKIAIWREDEIFFNKTTLEQACNMLEPYSNQKVLFDNETLANLTVSGKFSTLHFESFLKSIELIYPIKRVYEGKIIRIVKK